MISKRRLHALVGLALCAPGCAAWPCGQDGANNPMGATCGCDRIIDNAPGETRLGGPPSYLVDDPSPEPAGYPEWTTSHLGRSPSGAERTLSAPGPVLRR